MPEEPVTLTLKNGPPWGFRMAARDDGQVFVSQVLLNGNADQAGVEVGDVIEKMAKCPMSDLAGAHQALQHAAGTLELCIRRDCADSDISLINENCPPTPLPDPNQAEPSTQKPVQRFVAVEPNNHQATDFVSAIPNNVLVDAKLGSSPSKQHETWTQADFVTQLLSKPTLTEVVVENANLEKTSFKVRLKPTEKKQVIQELDLNIQQPNDVIVANQSVVEPDVEITKAIDGEPVGNCVEDQVTTNQTNVVVVTSRSVEVHPLLLNKSNNEAKTLSAAQDNRPKDQPASTVQTVDSCPSEVVPQSPEKSKPENAATPTPSTTTPLNQAARSNQSLLMKTKALLCASPARPRPQAPRGRISLQIGVNDAPKAPRSASLVAALSRKPPPPKGAQYVGGFQGSATDKRRFFEAQAARLVARKPRPANSARRRRHVFSPTIISRSACSTPTSDFNGFYNSFRSESSSPISFVRDDFNYHVENRPCMADSGQQSHHTPASDRKPVPPQPPPKPKSRPKSCFDLPFGDQHDYIVDNPYKIQPFLSDSANNSTTTYTTNVRMEQFETITEATEDQNLKPPIENDTSTTDKIDNLEIKTLKDEEQPDQPNVSSANTACNTTEPIETSKAPPQIQDHRMEFFDVAQNRHSFQPDEAPTKSVADLRSEIGQKLQMIVPGQAHPAVYSQIQTPVREWSTVYKIPKQVALLEQPDQCETFMPPGMRNPSNATPTDAKPNSIKDNASARLASPELDALVPTASQPAARALSTPDSDIKEPSMHQGLLLSVHPTSPTPSLISSTQTSPTNPHAMEIRSNVADSKSVEIAETANTQVAPTSQGNGYAASAEETEEEGISPLRNEDEKSWYRQMYRKMQCVDKRCRRAAETRFYCPDLLPPQQPQPGCLSKQAAAGLEPRPQAQSPIWAPDEMPANQRSRSVPRKYDPVADMEIVDNWARRAPSREGRPLQHEFRNGSTGYGINQFDESFEQINQNAGAIARLAHLPGPSTHLASPSMPVLARPGLLSPRHFHLPVFRLQNADRPRSAIPTHCGQSWRYGSTAGTWSDSGQDWADESSENLDQQGLRCKHRSLENVARLAGRHQIQEKLENAARDLDRLLGDLEAQQDKILRKDGNRRQEGELLQNGTATLSKGVRELKRLQKEEMINRQRADKLTMELAEQRSRRHGYIPNASPALQNNFSRLDQLMAEFQPRPATSLGFSMHNSQSTHSLSRRPSKTSVITCTALYSFTAQTPRELSLNRGDVVRLHREVDDHWLEGERNGQIGIFPAAYVQVEHDPMASGRNRVRAMFPFQARNSNELSLKSGEVLKIRRRIDANWVEGHNCHGQIGIFPRAYVKDLNEDDSTDSSAGSGVALAPDRPKTPKMPFGTFESRKRVTSPLIQRKEEDHVDEVRVWERRHSQHGLSGLAHFVPKNAETYRVIYPYQPKQSDELDLEEDDIVFVVEKCADGWFIGTSLRTGVFGTFPGNYVEKH